MYKLVGRGGWGRGRCMGRGGERRPVQGEEARAWIPESLEHKRQYINKRELKNCTNMLRYS